MLWKGSRSAFRVCMILETADHLFQSYRTEKKITFIGRRKIWSTNFNPAWPTASSSFLSSSGVQAPRLISTRTLCHRFRQSLLVRSGSNAAASFQFFTAPCLSTSRGNRDVSLMCPALGTAHGRPRVSHFAPVPNSAESHLHSWSTTFALAGMPGST